MRVSCQAQRTLADQAEASRIAELRRYLEVELPKLAGTIAESRVAAEARIDRLDRDLRSVVEQVGNTLAAYIGELEDRLDRGKTTRIPILPFEPRMPLEDLA